jgi:hypothetical protein
MPPHLLHHAARLVFRGFACLLASGKLPIDFAVANGGDQGVNHRCQFIERRNGNCGFALLGLDCLQSASHKQRITAVRVLAPPQRHALLLFDHYPFAILLYPLPICPSVVRVVTLRVPVSDINQQSSPQPPEGESPSKSAAACFPETFAYRTESGITQSWSLEIVRQEHVRDIWGIRDLRYKVHDQFVAVDILLENRFGKAEGEFRKIICNGR